MNWLDTFIISLVLSFDSAEIMFEDAKAYKGDNMRLLAMLPAIFGVAQGIMAILGYFAIGFVSVSLGIFSKVLMLLILAFIGIRMIFTVFRPEKKIIADEDLPAFTVITQALLSSVDGFAAGVGYGATGASIVFPSFTMASVTAAACFGMLFFGRYITKSMGNKIRFITGIFAIATGIKILF